MYTPAKQLLLLLLPVVAAALAPGLHERAWTPIFLQDYPLAICNDGTPGAYYLRPGQPGSRRWLVFLDGAGWCWDVASCSHDWQRMHGSSNSFPRTVEALRPRAMKYLQTGLFDPEKSPLADAHLAFVKSCSNDAFMGDKPALDGAALPFTQRSPSTGWHFRGRRIVEAVFADLRKKTGLGSMPGDHVIYGGCSAGARGVMVTIDDFASSPAIVGKAQVTGLLDSGFWVPISPRTDFVDWDSFGHQMRDSMTLVNSSGLVGSECGQKYPGAEGWKCLMGAYRMRFVRTPYFMLHSQYDLFALTMNLWGHFWAAHPLSPGDHAWAEAYRKMVVRYLPEPANHSGTVVYSPAVYIHCMCTVKQFWTIKASGAGLSDSIQKWLTEPAAVGSKTIEGCSGFSCGNHPQPVIVA